MKSPFAILLSMSFGLLVSGGCGRKNEELTGKGDPRLDGKYLLVGTEMGGVYNKEADLKQEYTFSGDKMIVMKGKNEEAQTISCDPAKDPAEITIRNKQTDGKVDCVYGIYKLNGDELTLCLRKTGNPAERPTSFKTTSESHSMVMILKKEK